MGFPVEYSEMLLPRALLQVLLLLGHLHRFLLWAFHAVGLGDLIDLGCNDYPAPPSAAVAERAVAPPLQHRRPEFRPVPAVLVEEALPVVRFEEMAGTACGGGRLRGVPERHRRRRRGAAAQQLPPRLPPRLPRPLDGARPAHLPALPRAAHPGVRRRGGPHRLGRRRRAVGRRRRRVRHVLPVVAAVDAAADGAHPDAAAAARAAAQRPGRLPVSRCRCVRGWQTGRSRGSVARQTASSCAAHTGRSVRRVTAAKAGHPPATAQVCCSSARVGLVPSSSSTTSTRPSAGETNGKGDRPGFYGGSGKEYE